jgi:hypothetical protein
MKFAQLILFMNLISISAIASAASVNRADAKKQLNISAGEYVVTAVDFLAKGENLCTEGQQFKWAPDEDQALCDKGAIHAVAWGQDTNGGPLLVIGQARTFSDFNSGLISNPPVSKKQCVISHNTQSQTGKLIDDSYLNCTNENSSTHAEIEVKGDTLNYTQVTKISRGGKVICLPLKCTLVKKAAK